MLPFHAQVSFNKGAAVTPDDSVNYPEIEALGYPLALSVGDGGVVIAVFPDDSTCSFTVPDGGWVPITTKRVNATTTDADLIVALWTV